MNKLKKYSLKEIAEIQTGPFGTQLHESDYVKEGTPIVSVEHLGEIGFSLQNLPLVSDEDTHRLSKYTLFEGDIVFSRVGSVDRCTYVSKKEEGWLFSGRCLRVRFGDRVEPKFISFYFRQKYFKKMMLNISVGATMPSLNTQLMESIILYLPSLNEQRKIAKVLSTLDSKIELNNRINAELEVMAKTIYDYWFVQFDFPDQNGKPYKASGGKTIWNEELKREIPEGWEVKDLHEIAKCIMGQSPKGESYNQDGIGIPLLNGPADYENGALKGRTFTTEPKRLCQMNDLVLCIRATIGNLVYSEQEFCLGRGVAAVRPMNNRLSELIYFLLIQEIERFKVQATGSIIVGIAKDDLIESKCLIPSDDLINSFHNLIKPQFDKVRINIKENQKLAELRDWLLPMLMNGQVKVKEATEYIQSPNNLSMAAEPEVRYGGEKINN
jgi:type I restriction enzyme S subunit